MLRATLRGLLARRLRLALSTLAVVAGVAFVAGTLVLTDTLRAAFTDLVSGATRDVAVDVRAVNHVDDASDNGRRALDASLLPRLAALDGVRAAVGQVSGSAVVVGPGGKPLVSPGAFARGVNWTGGAPTSRETIAEGREPRGDREIVMDRASARRFGVRVGDRVRVLTLAHATNDVFTVVGTFRTAGRDGVPGSVTTAFTTPVAQRLMMAPNTYLAVYLAARPGVSAEALAARAGAVLPDGVEAVTGARLARERASTAAATLGFLTTMLLVFAGISVFVGAFLIFNTFATLVAQRARELALLRALGASRGQVRLSVQVEAGLVGLAGAGAGLGAGVGLAALLRAVLGATGTVLPPGDLVFRGRTALVAVAVGVLVTSAAAAVPAHRAAAVAPVAVLRDAQPRAARSPAARAVAAGGALLAGAAAVLGGLAAASAPLVCVGAGVLTAGAAGLAPAGVEPVIRVLGAGWPRLFGVAGRLGVRNAARDPRRTAATASALMIGMALVSTFSIVGASVKATVRDTVTHQLRADYYVVPLVAGQNFSAAVVTALAERRDAVARVVGIRGGDLSVAGRPGKVLAADGGAAADVFALATASGSLRVGDGQIAMSAARARQLGLRVGARVDVVYPQSGRGTLTLVGTFSGGANLVTYLVGAATWQRQVPDTSVAMALVRRAPGADPAAARAAVEEVLRPYPGVVAHDEDGYAAEQSRQVDQLVGLVYVLLALAVVIALLGIVNTLALSMVERAREIGVLRAVGLRRDQLWLAVVVESVLVAVFGTALGVALGSFLGWALVTALGPQGVTAFAYPAATLAGVVVLGAVLGVLAAVAPALRAARMNVLGAIASS